ncbi:MAG: hypothetical protein HHJ09_10295 [Glaciimonas sp.]|nr:hypothetical protein [Glaciimonas sp.]
MDIKKLANLLLTLGIVLLLAAIAWWVNFYAPLMKDLNAPLSDALDCLYSNTGACNLASGITQLLGKTPYNPMLFLIGAGATCAGVLLRLTAKSPR